MDQAVGVEHAREESRGVEQAIRRLADQEAGNVKPQHAAGAGTAVEETGLLVAAHLAHRQILEALVGW